jgi:hypothetical protein
MCKRLRWVVTLHGSRCLMGQVSHRLAEHRYVPHDSRARTGAEIQLMPKLPGGRETVKFRFKNRSDQTVDATMTSPGLLGRTQGVTVLRFCTATG